MGWRELERAREKRLPHYENGALSARLLKYDVEDARRGKEESKVGVGMYLARARARA